MPRSRRHIFGFSAILAFFLLGQLSHLAIGDEVQQLFDSLYAEKISAVGKTLSRDDDLALAKQFVAQAKTSKGEKAFASLLCHHAYDLAWRTSAGYGVAVEAMEFLADSDPAQRADAREKMMQIFTRQMRSRDIEERTNATKAHLAILSAIAEDHVASGELTAASASYRRAYLLAKQRKFPSAETIKLKLEWVTSHDRATKRVGQLQQILLEDVTNTETAGKIIELFVMDLDAPKSALPFLDRAKDASLSKLVPLASGLVQQPTANDHLALAAWYKESAAKRVILTKRSLLEKARSHLTQYLEHRSASKLGRVKAGIYLDEINAEVASLPSVADDTFQLWSGAPPQAVKTKDWRVVCWHGSGWRVHPLTKMTVQKLGSETGVFKNTTGLHNHAGVAISPVLTGDFSAEIVIKNGGVSFQSDVGYDRSFGLVDVSSAGRTTRFLFERRNGKLSCQVDGKKRILSPWGSPKPDMTARIVVVVRSDQVVEILKARVIYAK